MLVLLKMKSWRPPVSLSILLSGQVPAGGNVHFSGYIRGNDVKPPGL
jgi:hypothetical protein